MLLQDQELVALCHKGEKQPFAILVERYQRLVVGLAIHLLRSREEAEDVAQEAFIRVYQQIQKQPDIEFLPYIKRVVSNLCLDKLRHRQVESKYLEKTTELETTDYQTPEQAALQKADQLAIRQAVNQLPDMYREVLVLHYSAGLSYQQIADKLGQPMSVIKNRIFRAKKLLKEAYCKQEGGDVHAVSAY